MKKCKFFNPLTLIRITVNIFIQQRGYNNLLGKMGERNREIDIETALKVASYDGKATFQELRQNLKK